MSLEDKQKELKELRKIDVKSDQDIERIDQLQDEIILIQKEKVNEAHKELIESMNGEEEKDTIEIKIAGHEVPEKKYKGIISGKIQKYLEERRERNKATPEKIKQLELEATKAELEARIAIAKGKKKRAGGHRFSIPTIPDKIFTETGKREYERTKSKISDNHKDYSALLD